MHPNLINPLIQTFIRGFKGIYKGYNIIRYNKIDLYRKAEERLFVSAPTTIHRWVMKDLPSFKADNFILGFGHVC